MRMVSPNCMKAVCGAPLSMVSMARLSATQDDLKRIIWPGWVPLLERGVVEVC